MNKYVITGGAGFIGSHIAEFLSNEGHQVTILDSLRTGFENNLNGLNVEFVKGDIRDENLVNELSLDVSKLDLGQSARVRDIIAVEGVEVTMSPSIPVVSIEIPRALRAAAAAEAKAAAPPKKKK